MAARARESPWSARRSDVEAICPFEYELVDDGSRPAAHVFADDELLADDRSATAASSSSRTSPRCPGIVRRASSACPTCTRATASRSAASRRRARPTASISPGGIGFDINCGVRLLALAARRGEASADAASRSSHELCREHPDRLRPRRPAGARRATSSIACSTRARELVERSSIGWRRRTSSASNRGGCARRRRRRRGLRPREGARRTISSARSAAATTSSRCRRVERDLRRRGRRARIGLVEGSSRC